MRKWNFSKADERDLRAVGHQTRNQFARVSPHSAERVSCHQYAHRTPEIRGLGAALGLPPPSLGSRALPREEFSCSPQGRHRNPASPQPAWSRAPSGHCIVACRVVHAINPSYPLHKITFLVKGLMRHRKSMSWTWMQPPITLQWLATDAHCHPLYAPGEKAGTKMKNHPPFGVAIVLASLLLVSPGLAAERAGTSPPTNDAIIHHMEGLEEQVEGLRAEVTALKGSDKPATPAAPAPVQSNLVTSAAAPGAAAAGPSLAGLLGPTTLSGFVDVYYGQNFNNPTSQTNSLR